MMGVIIVIIILLLLMFFVLKITKEFGKMYTHNMILMSRYKGQLQGGKKVQKICSLRDDPSPASFEDQVLTLLALPRSTHRALSYSDEDV